MPPPRTLSTSAIPVEMRRVLSVAMSEMGTGRGADRGDVPRETAATSSSGSLLPQLGQKPIHLPEEWPHEAHLKAMGRGYLPDPTVQAPVTTNVAGKRQSPAPRQPLPSPLRREPTPPSTARLF